MCIRVNPSMNANAEGNMRNAYGATDEKGCGLPISLDGLLWSLDNGETVGFAIFDHRKISLSNYLACTWLWFVALILDV